MSHDLAGNAPRELADHSIVVRGHRADGVLFSLAYSEQDELELQALAPSGAFEPKPDRDLLLAFDVAAWMRDIDLDRAEQQSDGSIAIDATHNVPLRLQFESNLDCSLELYEDTNGSQMLEAGDELVARCPPN
jgi:hypothetical protein